MTERNFHQNGEDYRYFCSFHNGENEYSFSLCLMKLSFLFDTDPDIPVTMPRLGERMLISSALSLIWDMKNQSLIQIV